MKKFLVGAIAVASVVMLSGCKTSYEPTYDIVINAEITIPNVTDYNATEECIKYVQGLKTVNSEYCGDFEVVSLFGLPLKNPITEDRYYNGVEYEAGDR